MKYLIPFILLSMSVGLLACGILLWKRRKEPEGSSRTILAGVCGLAALMSVLYLFRTWQGTLPTDGCLLQPEHALAPVLWLMCLLPYPLSLMQPIGSKSSLCLRLLALPVVLSIVGYCGGIAYVPLHSLEELCRQVGEANVWFRLLVLVAAPFYAFGLCLVRLDWRHTATSRGFLCLYAACLCLIGLLQLGVLLTLSQGLYLLQCVVWMLFLFGLTWYELCERLWVRRGEL